MPHSRYLSFLSNDSHVLLVTHSHMTKIMFLKHDFTSLIEILFYTLFGRREWNEKDCNEKNYFGIFYAFSCLRVLGILNPKFNK